MTSYEAFLDAAANDFAGLGEADFEQPRPAAIPARERRRAGLFINIAVEVAHQACERAGVAKDAVHSVFTSAMGDTSITDYMCRKLATPEQLLSPARFTNSVHNAASGYWSISAGNREPSTFVGGFAACTGAGLLEAASQAWASGKAAHPGRLRRGQRLAAPGRRCRSGVHGRRACRRTGGAPHGGH